ncbi:MAG: BamA/TamA family outer membrane protein [Planctomycetes bacterium]|nr:BamA/TamA family outer membrane protein [Planctomycetota bacterium]
MLGGGRGQRRAVFSAAALVAALAAPAAADEGVECRWDATLDPDASTLEVSGVVRVRNDGPTPLQRLPLVLYGNRFRTLDPAINDITYDRYYAPFFDEGRMDLRWARAADGRSLTIEPGPDEARPFWHAVTVDVVLAEPVEPGAWAEVHLLARLRVPSRLGPFGRRGRRLVLEGGWHPYVPAVDGRGARAPRGPPAMARHEVTLRAPRRDGDHALVDAGEIAGAPRVVVAPTPVLAVGPDLAELVRVPARGDAPGMVVRGEPGDEARARRIVAVAEQAAAFVRAHLPPAALDVEVAFVEAPLRDRFVHPTSGRVVLYSDRLFHVVRPLQQFHEAEVGRATIEALVRRALRDVALGADRDWVCEALGWHLARLWLERGRAASGLGARTITGGMGLLDFVPAIDSLLRAPRFVGSDLYYGRIWEPADAVPDDLSRALTRRARGRVALEKLRDVLGDERLEALARAALDVRDARDDPAAPGLAPGGLAASPMAARATALVGRDLGGFFALWTGPPPAQNLAIAGVDVLEDLPGGGQRVRVRIRRDGDPRPGEVGEPVVVETDGPDGPIHARWDGLGDAGEVITTRHGLLWKPVRLDPGQRVRQDYRGDDEAPAWSKVLVNRFNIRVDLNQTNRNEAGIGFTIHPFYDYSHAVLVDGFYEQDERGVTLGYAYGFGAVLDERTWGTVVSGRVTAEQLTRGVLSASGIEESKGNLLSVGAGLSFDTRLFQANPTWGLGVRFGYEHSDKTLGTDFRFDLFAARIQLVYSVIRTTQLALEVIVGQIVGTDIPTQRLFDAGGEDTVRGVEASRFVDRALIAIRGELRQMLVEDLDVPLLWVAWLRKVQVALFLDAGDVGPTLRDVFDARGDWKWGTGIGVRLWLDAFGVQNTVLRFDVGFRIDETRELGPQYYFGAGQSF